MPDDQTTGATRTSGRAATLWVAVAFAMLAGFPGAGLPAAFGQCQYEVTAIIEGTPCFPSGNAILIGWGLNIHGDVVGRFRMCGAGSEDEAFYWSEDTGLIALPMPEGTAASRAYDINDNRRIVGEYRIPFEGWFGFMYDMNTGEFLHLPSKHDWGGSVANAINNNSIAAGARSIGEQGTQNPPSNAVIWDTNTGEVVDLGVMAGGSSQGRAINESAMIAGLTGSLLSPLGYVSDDNSVLVLPPLPGGSSSFANDMNNAGIVVGGGQMDEKAIDAQPAVWTGGKWIGLGLLPGAHVGGATSINDHGQIGGSCTSISMGQRAFLWQHGVMLDLNELTLDISNLTTTRAINNNGQILTRLGNTRAALLTPIDVPFADLNFDCTVNEHDLLILLAAFGPQPSPAGSGGESSHPADFNGDGLVNVSDLLIMLGNWTF